MKATRAIWLAALAPLLLAGSGEQKNTYQVTGGTTSGGLPYCFDLSDDGVGPHDGTGPAAGSGPVEWSADLAAELGSIGRCASSTDSFLTVFGDEDFGLSVKNEACGGGGALCTVTSSPGCPLGGPQDGGVKITLVDVERGPALGAVALATLVLVLGVAGARALRRMR